MSTLLRNSPRIARVATSLLLLAALILQSGCQGCWAVSGENGTATWGCDSSADLGACGNGEAALIVAALYLALAIPYLIAEACRACQ